MINNNKKNKIGILGGTFNPIHNGHLILAQNALEFCDLDNILFIPSGCSYFKDQSLILPKNERIKMVSLAIENNDKFILSTIETEKEGNSYTYETLTELTNNNPNSDYYFIIGADTLYSIETWKNPDIIFSLSNIIVAPRDYKNQIELKKQADYLRNKFNANIIILDSPNIDISSTVLRNKVKNNKSIKYYVPDNLYEYIKSQKFYL